MSGAIAIRSAERSDAPLLLELIVELAHYERLAEHATGTVQTVEQWLFGPDRAAEALIAEHDGVAAGMAIFYRTFSTFDAMPGIWLEDLFVREEHRGAGLGLALMQRLAAITVERGYTRLEWVALDWNAPALGFYDALGARLLHDWRMLRLEGDGLQRVATSV